MFYTFQLINPAHKLSIGHLVAVWQYFGAISQVIKLWRQLCQKTGKTLAASTVHGCHTGYEGVHQPIQFTA